MNKTVVISVGGNALSNDPKKDEVLLAPVSKLIVSLYKKGYKVLLTTGNGPQSGEIFDIINDANKQNAKHMRLSLDEANAMSQSYIGYHVNKSVCNEMIKNKLTPNVCCLQTLTLVDEKDPGWKNPTKPIGGFFKTLAEAKKTYPKDKIVEDSGRGFRKVVASPKPVKVLGTDSINKMLNNKTIVITAIGGGVPCVIKNNKLIGKEGVIDKDYSTAKLASQLKADVLLILTGVENAYMNFNKPNQKKITKVDYKTLEKYISENDFGKGSMEPKLKAAVSFVKATKHNAIVTDIKNAANGICLKAGTIITN